MKASRASAAVVLALLLACSCAAAQQQEPVTAAAARRWKQPKPPSNHTLPSFKISAFRDITAYPLTKVQQELQGSLDVQLKWVPNADEIHADLRSGAADLVCMSYDDTLSMALQDNYTDIAAAWPFHGTILSLCGTIDVARGLKYVGIDTNTGYARMLRQELQKSMSPQDYAQLVWVYAGATNVRFDKLVAREINATLLNPPFTTFLGGSVPCQQYYLLTGPVQGISCNVRRQTLRDRRKRALLDRTFRSFKRQTLAMRNDPAATQAGLAAFYSVDAATAAAIYGSLWGVDGIERSFCFEPPRLANTERYFSTDTGIAVPTTRWWLSSYSCPGQRR